ncbi:MAG: M24 family metallopeptidase [Crocinitomicaceae bacterium]
MTVSTKEGLIHAEKIAIQLFDLIQLRNLIQAGKDELTLNKEIYELAKECFGIEKHWHKRIVRSGLNTLLPYKENPPNRVIQPDDILFFDFGPIVDKWEADVGRTYVIGKDPIKLKLKNDIEKAWFETKEWFNKQKYLKANELYGFAIEKAKQYQWEFGGEIAGHLIGEFPHEKLESGNFGLYIHPENNLDLFSKDSEGKARFWILELHFVDRKHKIGGFFEQIINNLTL